MPDRPVILLLAGTQEAYQLAERLTLCPGVRIISSLAGRTASPRQPAGEFRSGGFGGASGLAEFLQQQAVSAVVDATHPFARQISSHAAQACAKTATPLLRLDRPAWRPVFGDRWHQVQSWEEACDGLRHQSQRVFLAIGRQELAPFCALTGLYCLIRTVHPPDPQPPFANADWIFERGPFSVEHEIALLRDYRIDTVVCKNSGGPTDSKLAAARALGIAVVMQERPPRPAALTVNSVEQAVAWVHSVIADKKT